MSVKSAHTNKITQIPEEFTCPITLDIMVDPVICSDGNTYERVAIMAVTDSKSPLTREPFNKANLIPNRSLKNAIARFKESNDIARLTEQAKKERVRSQKYVFNCDTLYAIKNKYKQLCTDYLCIKKYVLSNSSILSALIFVLVLMSILEAYLACL